MNKPKVAVLMSVFNGMEWLPVQLESILNQNGVDVVVFLSVDVSSDGSEKWVEDISAKFTNVFFLPFGFRFGGAAKNFFRLIRDVDFSAFDYVSLSDQDDIWNCDKLKCAVEAMTTLGVSGYSSNVTAFWPTGQKLLVDKSQPLRKYDFIFEAAGPGCTYVLGVAEALRFKKFLLTNWSEVNEVALHDWLIYAWYRSCGLDWFIDPVPRMLYRQHAANQVGANSGLKAIKARFSLLYSGWYRKEILKILKVLDVESLQLPVRLLEYGRIPLYFLFKNFNKLRRRRRDRFFLILIVIFGLC